MAKRLKQGLALIIGIAAVLALFFWATRGPSQEELASQQKKLFNAIQNGDRHTVKTVLADNEGLANEKRDGIDPLEEALADQQYQIASILLDYGAKVGDKAILNAAALMVDHIHVTVWSDKKVKGRLGVFDRLMEENKGGLKETDEQGNTALHHAVLHGDKDMAALMIKHHANIRAVNKQRETILHAAAIRGDRETVSFILQKAPSLIHKVDKEGNTSFVKAIKNQRTDIYDLLLQADSSQLTKANNQNETPYDVATILEDTSTIDYLKRKKAME
ncbi:ankyrin repeat domain-containing protein [Bacillus testis]|uniref:ankyrin repeat domain-containing protein n=1 Tax=Bacillus testis TaxID=1622072 RepID=UPI00067F0F23|nr:ankyrin repeat domain-containing protein [Bacillus testis]